MSAKKESKIFTYPTRLRTDKTSELILSQSASVLSRIERHLFADISKGHKANDLKSIYLKKYGITARHFNAIRMQLEGKIASLQEIQALKIPRIEERISSVKKLLVKLEKTPSKRDLIHQKKRLLFNLELKLKQLQSDKKAGKISLCFGSSKLFHSQFDLEKNGYKNHEEWRVEWKKKRNSSFFLVGSKDEVSGNQSCTATIAEDGSISLKIRLPDCISKAHGKYLFLNDINFAYGHQEIIKALESCRRDKSGVPISYRFKRNDKGWYVYVSVPFLKTPLETSTKKGVIGVDINANHIAIAETDHFGNPIAKRTIPLNTYGKTSHQSKALIGDMCKELVKLAKEKGKTLIIEELDFSKKKATLKEQGNTKYARMLSSFSYSAIKNGLTAKAWREGVEVCQVNPAYTSVIGRIKFANRYGLSIHHAAALTIGRRHLRASERVPRHLEKIPDGTGDQIALAAPVRKRDKHVWSTWRTINLKLKTALAGHFRSKRNRSLIPKPDLEINKPKVAVEITARESSTQLLGWRL